MDSCYAVAILTLVGVVNANLCPPGQTLRSGSGCCPDSSCTDGHRRIQESMTVWNSGSQSTTCVNPTCVAPPCSAALLGDVGCTTVSGTEAYNHELIEQGQTIPAGAHIQGPFEAGMTQTQKSIFEAWGCTNPESLYDTEGGLDIGTAEGKVSYLCQIKFPRLCSDTTYTGLVGPCGGHTSRYHFHRSLKCLYSESGAHSTAVGIAGPWKIYGKWEDYTNNQIPLLDACGGHFGPTPSGGSSDYHYHVQDKAPFTIGCHGPTHDNKLVSVATCRTLYPSCDGTLVQLQVGESGTTISYDRFCPCFDAAGLNYGTIQELPALSSTSISVASTTNIPGVPNVGSCPPTLTEPQWSAWYSGPQVPITTTGGVRSCTGWNGTHCIQRGTTSRSLPKAALSIYASLAIFTLWISRESKVNAVV